MRKRVRSTTKSDKLVRAVAKLNVAGPGPAISTKDDSMTLRQLLLGGGNAVGSFLTGGTFPKIFGSGAYSMTPNTCFNVAQQVPVVHSSSETIRFRHREYICDIVSQGAGFGITTIAINPGMVPTFPFLSQIAANFQEYAFR